MRIEDKVAVVTGGASGLGLACVRKLRRRGAHVVAIDANPATLETLEQEGVATYQLDVSSAAQVEDAFESIRKHIGAAAVLVNCAGVATPGTTVRRSGAMPLNEFRRIIEINLIGTLNTIRCAAAHMISTALEQGHDAENGVIINTSSIASTEGQMGQAAYSASKGGVSAITLPLARELGKFGVRVNAISPGVFETPMTTQLPEKSRKVVFSAVPPYPRRPGSAEEYADLVTSILEQPMLNGTVLRLDGGLRMPARY
ncbi:MULTISPECIES: SDR family NAD(P)-dependent oxidoreductase [unclassified Burkholderia]|uniref:SDR family NAD(P)-dependent oxidoreductase n=1 Tax=unclassified Burkholderia TaxID=2613784 RepID=UPI002AB04990|nr:MULTISPECIES: SDR family NAD(P)-dependent oxidoreductase [unclassified Burkholderia]